MLYSTPQLDANDLGVLKALDELREKLRHRINLSKRWTGSLRRLALARAIQGSNSIEGHNVSTTDAVAAVMNDEPTEANSEDWNAVTGYRQAMGLVLQIADDQTVLCSAELLRSLHFMIIGQDQRKNPARWRSGLIYVRDDKKNLVVYEGPEADLVPSLMDEFVHSLNSLDNAPVLVRAAMAHLNLVLIHPFSDGNGRTARCLQSLILARNGVLGAEFCSIEDYLGKNTPDYYDALAAVSKGKWNPLNDSKPFVRFCLKAHYQQANFLIAWEKCLERTWDVLEREIEKRSLPDRSIFGLSDAVFAGSIRNSGYRRVAEISELSASRDLKLLVEAGLLIPVGEKRGRSYKLTPKFKKQMDAVIYHADFARLMFADPYEAATSSIETQQLSLRLPDDAPSKA
jgi:Fic family protein